MKTKKQQTKQRIVATLIILFMMLMTFGTLDVPGTSATVTTTNLIQNVIASGAGLGHAAMSDIGFNDITLGTAINSRANMIQTNVWDFRGNGAGWGVTAVCTNLVVAVAGINYFDNATQIAWDPSVGTIISIAGSTSGITLGTAGLFSSTRTLVSSTTNNGMGNYRVNNVLFNVIYNGRMDQKIGTYTAVLTMTSA
jgi:hypothetical protein